MKNKVKAILYIGQGLKLEIFNVNVLIEADSITSNYKDLNELLIDYKDIICKYFSINYSKDSFFNIASISKLKICFYDKNNYYKEIDPIYKDNKKKLNPSSMLLHITKKLKSHSNSEKLATLLNQYMYMFNSQFNIKRNNIYNLKNIIQNEQINNDSTIKTEAIKKVLKIIKNDLSYGYDKTTKEISPNAYINMRIIFNFVNNEPTINKEKNTNITIEQKTIEDILFDEFILQLDKNEHLTMGEIAYLFDEYKSKKLLKQ